MSQGIGSLKNYQYTYKELQWISVRCSIYVGYQPLVYVDIFQFNNILKRDCFDLTTKGKCNIKWFFSLGFSKTVVKAANSMGESV